MSSTFCHRLWDEYYVSSNGNVYTCCHHKAGILGNIKENKLEEIYNNDKIKNYRAQSLNGKLKCFKSCSLLKAEELKQNRPDSITVKSSQLNRLKISFGEGCNINCRMCWQNSKSTKMLNFDLLKNQITLSHFNLLEIQGGEPFFIKSARQYLEYALNTDVKITILTNGTIMNKEIATGLLKSSHRIIISLNAVDKKMHEYINRGSNWELVLKNIALLRKLRDEAKSNLKIIGHMTIIVQNINEIPQFLEKYKTFGFDEIEFGYDLRVPIFFKFYKNRKEILKRKIINILDNCNDLENIELNGLNKLGLTILTK